MTVPGPSRAMGRPYRLVIADDHAIMRDGLAELIGNEGDFEVVGTADDGKVAIDIVDREHPDVVLIDLSMPRTDGAQAIRVIKRKHPETRVLVLTFHKEDAHIHVALEAGADGFILKDEGRDELLTALRVVAGGRSYLSPAICDRVMSGYLRGFEPVGGPNVVSWDSLTAREQQVLKLVAEGYKTREIATYLSLSEKTVEKHRRNMMRKLDLNGVSAVTAYAIENGVLSR
jgi:DNA-binding NarL/FixJ family response regulator